MGHLINSNALRLGWFLNWSDSWYYDHAYYSEFLYNILRIRFFLSYFFSLKQLEKAGYFYSHFEIIQKYNFLKVNIFIYDGWVESLMDELSFEHQSQIKKLNSNPSKRKPLVYFKSWKILTILSLINKFILHRWSKGKIRYLIKSLNFFNKKALLIFLSKTKLHYRSKGCISRIIFFFSLFLKIKMLISFNFIKSKAPSNLVISRFLYIITWFSWNKNLFASIKEFLLFIFFLLVPNNNFFVNFFAITNYAVNSKFLSRYLGKKLKQNYSVMELLNPIKRELRVIISRSKYSLSNYFYFLNRSGFKKDTVARYKRGIFKHLFLFYILFLINIIIIIIMKI